jgi:S-adenosylmethionine:tRNA ribosyltransferase-isomerase
MYTLDNFDFDLPQDLIAYKPADNRDASRLFVLDRNSGSYIHSEFSMLPGFLREGDVLVFNDARVISARIACQRHSGGSLEILLTQRIDDRRWIAISNRTKRIRPGEVMFPVRDKSIEFRMIDRTLDTIEIVSSADLNDEVLSRIGEIALPPYIRRDVTEADRDRYQTVYARESGAVAAPTAGLHFTDALLEAIRAGGARTVFLTLHVSWGTFQPVRDQDLERHRMHAEKFTLGADPARIINEARSDGCRIIAVGTTSLRVLESTYRDGINVPGSGETDIFIYPPRKILSVDSLITNFHTPRSTLLMLVASFAGYDTIMNAYREAVNQKYRFFSYGDAMLLL